AAAEHRAGRRVRHDERVVARGVCGSLRRPAGGARRLGARRASAHRSHPAYVALPRTADDLAAAAARAVLLARRPLEMDDTPAHFNGAARADRDGGKSVGWAKARDKCCSLFAYDDAAPCPPLKLRWARRASLAFAHPTVQREPCSGSGWS